MSRRTRIDVNSLLFVYINTSGLAVHKNVLKNTPLLRTD